MAPSLPQVEAQALQLSPDDRARLAELLWQSLDDATENGIAQAWHDELGRRVQALEAGQCELVASDVVMAGLRARLSRD
jgi:putative addiction module component (TIGR02574 family)